MKILWCVNILLPAVAQAIGALQNPFDEWMVSLSSGLAMIDGIKLRFRLTFFLKMYLNFHIIPKGLFNFVSNTSL